MLIEQIISAISVQNEKKKSSEKVAVNP